MMLRTGPSRITRNTERRSPPVQSPIGRGPGRCAFFWTRPHQLHCNQQERRVVDVARVEKIEGDLNALIERRATQRDKANAEADLWAMSERRHHARLREERLRDRLAYHRAMLEAHTRNFEELLRRHRVGLRLCEEALGIAAGPGNGRA